MISEWKLIEVFSLNANTQIELKFKSEAGEMYLRVPSDERRSWMVGDWYALRMTRIL